MRVSLTYPKIPNTLNCPLKQCIAFSKEDGTNIHAAFSPSQGFHSFGTRRDRFSADNDGFAQFHKEHPGLDGFTEAWDKLIPQLEAYLLDTPKFSNAREVIVFTEFYGDNSFAGKHILKDNKQLVIFDVSHDGIILPPEEFVDCFGGFNSAKVVFKGKFTGQLLIDVRKGRYPVKEGVVVKGMVNGSVYMAKIKTERYMDLLKREFGNNWKNYWE
jgi:hypothetical protein